MIARIRVEDGTLTEYPIAERVHGGWQNGVCFYPDEKVAEVLGEYALAGEWEYGVEYEVSATESVWTAAHSEKQARKWVEQSPTDTGLRRRRAAGPWSEIPEGQAS